MYKHRLAHCTHEDIALAISEINKSGCSTIVNVVPCGSDMYPKVLFLYVDNSENITDHSGVTIKNIMGDFYRD